MMQFDFGHAIFSPTPLDTNALLVQLDASNVTPPVSSSFKTAESLHFTGNSALSFSATRSPLTTRVSGLVQHTCEETEVTQAGQRGGTRWGGNVQRMTALAPIAHRIERIFPIRKNQELNSYQPETALLLIIITANATTATAPPDFSKTL